MKPQTVTLKFTQAGDGSFEVHLEGMGPDPMGKTPCEQAALAAFRAAAQWVDRAGIRHEVTPTGPKVTRIPEPSGEVP